MAELQPIAEYVFECSWEICNKVGGIYTVVKTKAASMQSYYSNYILVGPYFKKKAEIEFEYLEPPKSFAKAFDVLAQEGIICHYGKWNIKSEPVTILIEFLAASDHINDIKKELWDRYQVDSIRAGWEFEEPVLWSWYVARMIEEVSKNLGSNNVVSHWHEWLAGAGLLYLRSKDSQEIKKKQ